MVSQRLLDIARFVNQSGVAGINDLSTRFGVSIETIRRDLRALENDGYLKRTHGGAMSLENSDSGLAFNKRQHEHQLAKKLIAHKAVTHIKNGDTIMLDASSTCWYLSKILPDINITVITNSLRILLSLANKKNIKTISVGGEFSEKYAAFVGSITCGNLSQYRVDILFFSCSSFDPVQGIWENNEINASTKQVMLSVARKKILLADADKSGRIGLFRICQTQNVDHIITNNN